MNAPISNPEQPYMYHGSSKKFKKLKPKKHYLHDKPVVFGTPLIEVALSFAAPWKDDILSQGMIDDMVVLMELEPNAFVKTYGGKKGWVYTLDSSSFFQTDNLTRYEYISEESPEILNVEKVDDVLMMLFALMADIEDFYMVPYSERFNFADEMDIPYEDLGI